MFERTPPSKEFMMDRLGGNSQGDAELFELANMFGQISTNLNRALQAYAERAGMQILDGQALFAIAELGGDARPGDIAEHLKMPLSTMTGVATRLVSAGLVERKPAPGDGRAAILAITETGTNRIQEMFGPVIQDVAEILESYGPDAIEQMTEGFRIVLSLTATLEAQVKADRAKS